MSISPGPERFEGTVVWVELGLWEMGCRGQTQSRSPVQRCYGCDNMVARDMGSEQRQASAPGLLPAEPRSLDSAWHTRTADGCEMNDPSGWGHMGAESLCDQAYVCDRPAACLDVG